MSYKKTIRVFLSHLAVSFLLIFGSYTSLNAQETDSLNIDDIFKMSLEELMDMKITSASNIQESTSDAPATVIVITQEDIQNRGYTDISEVLVDLPGFDNILTNGTSYMVSYQRGYRTNWTQRTLVMIDGKVTNHLWSHDAFISRQYPMSTIDRIEVLYGPASSIYGANAFLGVINIITKEADKTKGNYNSSTINMQYGSYNTKALDITTIGNSGDVSYSFSQKLFRSDDPNLEGKWGFVTNELYSDTNIWGPILNQEHRGRKLGDYYDGASDYSFMGNISFKSFKLGIISWETKEGYGPYYAADRTQNNTFWNNSSLHIYLENNKEINKKLTSNTLLLYRESRLGGKWAEALPDLDQSVIPNDTIIDANGIIVNENFRDYSWVSYSDWNSDNSSWLFKQNFNYQLNSNIQFSGGVKWEHKELTKAYDAPGYWHAFSSSVPSNDPGPYGYGTGIYHSSDSELFLAPAPSRRMPSQNIFLLEDIGGFVQSIIDYEHFRFSLGIRSDYTNLYGHSTNPRVSAIYKFNKNKGAIKLMYGEAYQEPPPLQLYGGFGGRISNPDLIPEKAQNLELATMYNFGSIYLDASGFYAQYNNVIKEEAENAGSRTIYGGELRISYKLKHFIANSSNITGYLYYSYIKSISSISYDFNTEQWVEGEGILGDIAPHKINAGINLPITKSFNLNARGNFISKRILYLRNPLRNDIGSDPDFLSNYPELSYKDGYGIVINPYFTLDGTFTYHKEIFSISLKVKNILNAQYFHPGVESASAGRDFENRSDGFQNSILAQPGKSYLIGVTLNF